MTVDINPVPAYPNSGCKLMISNVTVELNNTATFITQLLDISGQRVAISQRVSLTSGQYENWTGADSYVVGCIVSNLGLSLAPE